jgi:hypothetical protein
MSKGHCPECGRFLSSVEATTRLVVGGEALDRITGICHLHGEVEAMGEWWWEDFFGDGD